MCCKFLENKMYFLRKNCHHISTQHGLCKLYYVTYTAIQKFGVGFVKDTDKTLIIIRNIS